MRAVVIVPVFNGWEFTEACLESLMPTLREGDGVLVADNASSDATHHELFVKRRFGAEYLGFGKNFGFAGACNRAASWITALEHPYALVFLNNDTVVYPGWLDELLIPLADDDVGAVGPVSNFVSGSQLVGHEGVPGGDSWRVADPASLTGLVTHLPRSYARTERLVGFCLATRASTFAEVGGFSEDYGLGGYEDDDYCAKLRVEQLEMYVARSCFVYHHGHATFEANGLDRQALQDSAEATFLARWGD